MTYYTHDIQNTKLHYYYAVLCSPARGAPTLLFAALSAEKNGENGERERGREREREREMGSNLTALGTHQIRPHLPSLCLCLCLCRSLSRTLSSYLSFHLAFPFIKRSTSLSLSLSPSQVVRERLSRGCRRR